MKNQAKSGTLPQMTQRIRGFETLDDAALPRRPGGMFLMVAGKWSLWHALA